MEKKLETTNPGYRLTFCSTAVQVEGIIFSGCRYRRQRSESNPDVPSATCRSCPMQRAEDPWMFLEGMWAP